MRRRRRGVVLIASLFLMLFMAMLATHLFYLKMSEHRAGVQHRQELQAQQAAEAGLEDARVKLSKDPSWPVMSSDQTVYFYSDVVTWNGVACAEYKVAVRETGDNEVTVTSWGTVGDSTSPVAQRQMEMRYNRDTARITRFVDWGSF